MENESMTIIFVKYLILKNELYGITKTYVYKQ